MSATSFEGFFQEVLPDAIRVGRRILGNQTDAEDAAAEAFARAHASWSKIGGLEHRQAWVLRVTANVAVDMTRKRSRSVPMVPDRVDDTADHTILSIALGAALGALSRRQREIVVLRYLQGYSESETARAIGVSIGTVKKTAHRATAALRERLGEAWVEEMGGVSGAANRG